MFNYFFALFLLFSLSSCSQNPSQLINNFVHEKLSIFNSKGEVDFAGLTKIWQHGNRYIEEVNIMKSLTQKGVKKIWFEPMFYQYISMQDSVFANYYSLTDTATIIKKGRITDSISNYGGWDFWSTHILNFNYPTLLSDTVVADKNYKRLKYYFYTQDTTKIYSVALLEPATVLSPFSLEKNYCKEHGYNVFKILDYVKKSGRLYAIREVVKVANTLTPQVKKIFEKWN
jgi:hypothetical protein